MTFLLSQLFKDSYKKQIVKTKFSAALKKPSNFPDLNFEQCHTSSLKAVLRTIRKTSCQYRMLSANIFRIQSP